MAIWPRPLKPGMTIGVLSPASPISTEKLARGVRALRERGFGVKLGRNLLANDGYLAGDDAARLADWRQLWEDPEVAAVWCARGGYGTMRLLPALDYDLIGERRLPFVGYSDITAIQGAILRRCGLVTFSGAMVASGYGYGADQGIDADTAELLWRWLDPSPGEQPLANPGGEPPTVLRGGRAVGRLIGGCLTLVSATLGTPYAPDFTGGVLVLEDVDEDPYRLDRYLAQLQLAGVFEQVAAVVLGDFESCYPPRRRAGGPAVEELLLRFVGDRDIPLLSGLRYGHIRRRCALPLGAEARVDGDKIVIRVEGTSA